MDISTEEKIRHMRELNMVSWQAKRLAWNALHHYKELGIVTGSQFKTLHEPTVKLLTTNDRSVLNCKLCCEMYDEQIPALSA